MPRVFFSAFRAVYYKPCASPVCKLDGKAFLAPWQPNSPPNAATVIDKILPRPGPLVVHDSGCGTGEVTRATVAYNLPSLIIKANDNDPLYVEAYAAATKSGRWPAVTFNMSSDALEFSDNMCDISYANFVIFLVPEDGVPAIREMRRTSKPGLIAIYTA
jgi:ubiquinone/menaquinone biosynthesis C-methylase UbiE